MLIKIKDICYDKEKEVITQIPALMYNHVSKKFTLKRHDNRVSTTKSLNLGKTRKNLKVLFLAQIKSKWLENRCSCYIKIRKIFAFQPFFKWGPGKKIDQVEPLFDHF